MGQKGLIYKDIEKIDNNFDLGIDGRPIIARIKTSNVDFLRRLLMLVGVVYRLFRGI